MYCPSFLQETRAASDRFKRASAKWGHSGDSMPLFLTGPAERNSCEMRVLYSPDMAKGRQNRGF